MYKIFYEVHLNNGSKIKCQIACPNTCTTREKRAIHGKHYWNKVDSEIYTCSECGCKMTMKTEYEEVEVK